MGALYIVHRWYVMYNASEWYSPILNFDINRTIVLICCLQTQIHTIEFVSKQHNLNFIILAKYW